MCALSSLGCAGPPPLPPVVDRAKRVLQEASGEPFVFRGEGEEEDNDSEDDIAEAAVAAQNVQVNLVTR